LPGAPGTLTIEEYDRTPEQEEILGLTDIRTAAVETDHGMEYVKE
jgi:hypothetical protein